MLAVARRADHGPAPDQGRDALQRLVAAGQAGHAGPGNHDRRDAQTGGLRHGHVGKWHLGYSPETMPLAQGFDFSFGHMGGCIDNYSHFFYWGGPNRHDLTATAARSRRRGDFSAI